MNSKQSKPSATRIDDPCGSRLCRALAIRPLAVVAGIGLLMLSGVVHVHASADTGMPYVGPQSADASSLFNVSTRGRVRDGASVMIGGFVIRGGVSKRVLIRARSPAVANPMPDPTLRLFSGATQIGFNDNWRDSQEAEIIATGRQPPLDSDAALIATLAPGPYTVHVRDASEQTGIALFEVLGIDEEPDTRLFNLSTRAKVETGADVTIGGFVIRGDEPKQVLIRGRGPTVGGLSPGAELVDPTLQLYKDGIVIADNDDWNAGHQAGAIAATRRAPRNEAGTKEAAILATLAPGPYSAHLRGAELGTGIGIVEIIAVGEDVNEPEVFETFSDPTLSAERWRDREFRRVPGSLVIEQRLSGETASVGNNSVLIDDPVSVDSISVPVTVEFAEVVDPVDDNGAVRARVGGFWYNDGTGGGLGQTGDILAEVVLMKTGSQALQADALVFRCTNADCTSGTLLFTDPGFAEVQVGEEHQLHVEWDGTGFTFEIDGQPTSHIPGGTIAPAAVPRRWLGTRIIDLGTADEEGHIRARFGNVSVNGVLYDDFQSVRLDPEKWLLWDFERGITNGAFQSRLATHDGTRLTNNLRMRNPDDVVAMRADLTIVSMANDGMMPRARVAGYWYNTGLPGSGATGELFGEIAVVEVAGERRFRGYLFRCEDPDCVAGTTIFNDDTTFGEAEPGVPYAVGIEWDGTRFTFSVDGEEISHEPTGIGALAEPSRAPLRLIGTSLRGSSGSGHVHAVFDNVDVDRAP